MATEQVQNWIQNEIKLSKIVTSFELDFENGYLFGEILSQYGLVDDMSSFSKKSQKDFKVRNFQQIESALRGLKVKFDAKLINQIMNAERGASLRLLYQLKLALNKFYPSDPQAVENAQKTMTGLKHDQVDRKFEEVMQLKYTLPKTQPGLKTMFKSKKLEPIEKTLLKFEQTKNTQVQNARQAQQKEEQLIQKLYQDERQKQMRTMSENKQFMNEWMEEGKKNWKVNQQNRQATMARQKYFEDKEVDQFKKKLNKELDEATGEMMGGIDEFEKNLQKLGIEKNINIEQAKKKMEEKKGVPPGQIQNFSYAATVNKIKEKKNLADFAAKERDRRRRKMIVDQTKTQSSLEQKKNEELLIQKLMKKQEEEQQFAYLEWRAQECKALIFRNREQKAQEVDLKKQAQTQEIERLRNEEYNNVIVKHKEEIAQKKREYQQIRRQEKREKRLLNAEICSEVLDLILDVADEAFEKTSKRQNKKLQKPEWREWMSIFVDNKLVSSVVGDNKPSMSQQLLEPDIFTNNDDYDPLTDPQKQLQQLLDEMKYEPAYSDLMEYLSVSGLFSLHCFSSEWSLLSSFSKPDISFDFHFLQSLIPPENKQLGLTLQQILKDLFKQNEQQDDDDDENNNNNHYKEQIPHYLPIKLCLLGRKYAGKRTIAKQISEYFNNKVKVFKMDEIVKEAVDYINPKPVVQETNQAKKAPAKKGPATEEAQVIDQFAGQDTKEYKEIAHQIKTCLGDNFDFAGHFANSQQDLASLINDSQLIVRLLIQKLRLSFAQEKPEQQINQEIKQSLQREKEILEQLAEIEAQNQAMLQANPVDKKSGKPAPAKGGKAPQSNEDQLRQELNLIQKIQCEGWILLDFPKTLEQAKAMESLMTGYQCLIDIPKPDDQQRFEQWSKIVSPASIITDEGFDGEAKVVQGASDGMIFLDVPSEECIRRSQNRKIDPQTGIIYHLEDSPPPEGDNKLRDRLQDYNDPDADAGKMAHNHQGYDENSASLKKWVSTFGLKDNNIIEKQLPVSSLLHVSLEQKTKKEEVIDKVLKQVQGIVAFKQAQYDFKKQQVKEQISQEALAQQLSQEQSLQQTQQDQQLTSQDQYLQSQSQEQQELTLQQQPGLNTQKSHYSTLDYERKSTHKLGSQGSQRVRSEYRSERPPQPFTKDEKKDIWEGFEKQYYRDCLLVFRNIRRQRDLVLEGCNDIQKRFIEYLHREDNKQQKINDFVESFNKFSAEFPDLREDEQTKEELLTRVDLLSQDLWSVIEKKKDESLEEHQRIIGNGWIQVEMKKLIRSGNSLIQSELNKFSSIYKMIVGFHPVVQVNVDQLFGGIVDSGTEPYSQKEKQSPILSKLLSHIIKSLQQQLDSQQQLDPDTKYSLDKEVQNTIYKLNMINTWITLKIKEFDSQSSKLFDMLDDWVLIAVEHENELAQSVIQKLRQAIFDGTTRLDYSPFNLQRDFDLNSKIERIGFSASNPPEYLQQIVVDSDFLSKRFRVEDLELLFKEMQYYSFDDYLDGQTFIHIVQHSISQDKCPKAWRQMSFQKFNELINRFQAAPIGQDNGQQLYGGGDRFSTSREFIDWKIVFTMFTLLQVDFYDQVALNDYTEKLMSLADENGDISMHDFIHVDCFFDPYESKPEFHPSKSESEDEDYGGEDNNDNQDYDRVLKIKTLLFRTHQSTTMKVRVEEYKKCLQRIYDTGYGAYNCYTTLFNY